MQIILSAVRPKLFEAWQKSCGDLENVTIHRGSILELTCDALVSPSNSFGFMDGGIDMLYSQHFGWHVQESLQKLIREKHYGELLVGTAEIVETDNRGIPYLIAAPTMRVPSILENSVNPYLAARAVLLLVRYGTFSHSSLKNEAISSVVDTIAFPGLGTGVGGLDPNICARQVRAAIEDVILCKNVFPKSWADAQQRHQKLYTDYPKDLQYKVD